MGKCLAVSPLGPTLLQQGLLHQRRGRDVKVPAPPHLTMSTGRAYLVRFAQIKEDFRLAELRAICNAEGIVFPEKESDTYSTAVRRVFLCCGQAHPNRQNDHFGGVVI